MYVLIHQIIFWLYLYFLNIVPYFSSTPVLTFSMDVVFILSIACGEIPVSGHVVCSEMPVSGPCSMW